MSGPVIQAAGAYSPYANKPYQALLRQGAKQSANMFRLGASTPLNPFAGVTASGVGMAALPVAVAAGPAVGYGLQEQSRKSGQDIPTQMATQTKPFSGLGWDKPGQSYATGSISPVKQEVNTNLDAGGRMPIHWGKGSLNLPTTTPPPADQTEMGPPISAKNPEGGGDKTPEFKLPNELPYDPRFEMANKANYAQATQAIDSRMEPALGKMNGLLNEFRNYTPTGKSSIGAQTALNAIMGLTPQVANLHATHAQDIGKLPLMEMGQSAMKQGALPMQQSQIDLFQEKLPTAKAKIQEMSDKAKYRQMMLNQKEKEAILKQQGKLSDTELHPKFSKGKADLLQQMILQSEDPAKKTAFQKMLFDEMQKGEYTPIRRSASALGTYTDPSEEIN